MNIHKIHRVLGLIMIIPLFLWAITGFIFLTKPGYEGAYERLTPRQYELKKALQIIPQPGWKDIQLKQSILGLHLIVNDKGSWKHLDPATYRERPFPAKEQVTLLITDAMEQNKPRYGKISTVNENIVVTDTGVEIALDWSRLTLQQRGRDTELISTLYKIHYLQWLGMKSAAKLLGILGLLCLITLSAFGFASYLKSRQAKP